jgi:hypothetical protein
MSLKTVQDRMTETIRLLKQVLDLGIAETDPGYQDLKNHLSEWVKSEDKHVKEHVIEFYRYGRKGNLTLPWKSGKSCEFLLKAPRNI